MPCLSVQFNPAVGPILSVVITPGGVVKAATIAGQVPEGRPTNLLVDTGADITCISPKVASDLKLRSLGKKPVQVPTGPGTCNTYMIDLGVPFGDPFKGAETLVMDNLLVMEFLGANPNYDGLLGRDILGRGFLTMAPFDRRFTICF